MTKRKIGTHPIPNNDEGNNMSKPKTIPVPEAQASEQHRHSSKRSSMQEPLSGSKKVKIKIMWII